MLLWWSFSFKDICNIVLYKTVKKAFLSPMAARNNTLWTALRMASRYLLSSTQDGDISLSNRKQWAHQLFASLLLLHFLNKDVCFDRSVFLWFVCLSCFMFHSSKHCIWICSLILGSTVHPPMQKETQHIKRLGF